MEIEDDRKLNLDIRFPISNLYYDDFYSTSLPTLGNVKFILTFFIQKDQLKIKFERNTLDLATYSIKISSCQPDPLITKSQIRFDKGQKNCEISLKDASDYIFDQFYSVNIQIEPKTFHIPKYQDKPTSQTQKKQSKLGDFFVKTTEDYLGLPNQGATCYLNSLLQVLYHLKKFRKMIYEEKVEPNESNIIFCLQLLFRDLQLRKSRRSTRHLTNALKWDREEVSTSQDVSEFYKFFFDRVMKGITATSLFEGEFNNKITNLRDSNRRLVKEIFIQIMLKVEGFSNITDSFKMFTSPFSFYDNQAKNGANESIKQMSISKFPPVLSIVLKRYTFNKETSKYEKLNSIMVFPNIFDFSEFGYNQLYQLFAIIAHIGTIYSGHYVCFINIDLKGNWYEFDDNKVYKRSQEETFDLCYGKKKMGAYMLFYVKQDLKDDIFCDGLNIPQYIEKYKYAVVKEPAPQFFMNNEDGIIKNLKKLKTSYLNIDARKSIPIEFGTSFNEIYSKVASLWNKKPSLIRIWNVKNDSLVSVFNRKEKLKKNDNNRCWFVQDISESEELNIFEDHFVAFLTFYLPGTKQKLFFLGSHQFSVFEEISSIEKVVCKNFLLQNFPLFFFAFIKDRVIPITNPSLKFIDLALVFNGIFFIVQTGPEKNISFQNFSINLSNQIEKDFQNECKIVYNDVKEVNIDFADSYINSQFNQLTIYLFNFLNTEKPIAKLIVQKGSSSSHLKNLIAFVLGLEFNENEDTILLFNKSCLDKFLDEESLSYILQKGNSTNNLCFLVYMGIKEFNQFNQMKIKICYKKKQMHFFIIKNESKIMIQKNLIDNNFLPDKKPLRFYLVYKSRITSILNDNDPIPDDKGILHIEDIPMYQMEEDIFILRVSQAIKEGDELVCFDDPFIIGVKFDEFCINVKERISLITGVDIKKINILTQVSMGKNESYRLLMDQENILDSLDGNNEIFVLLGL